MPGVLQLDRARLIERAVETIDGVRVTTPLRTLIDVMVEGELAIEIQAQAIDEALRCGLIRRRQIEDVTVSTRPPTNQQSPEAGARWSLNAKRSSVNSTPRWYRL